MIIFFILCTLALERPFQTRGPEMAFENIGTLVFEQTT